MATVNKQAVAAAFGRAASGYTQHDELQRRCADLLLASWRAAILRRCWMPAAAPAV